MPYVTGVIFWRYWSALRLLVNRDLHQKYRELRLGYLWAILEPFGLSLTMWFVFQILLGGRKFGLQPYYLFLTVAILPWWWFVNGISASTRTCSRHQLDAFVSVRVVTTFAHRGAHSRGSTGRG